MSTELVTASVSLPTGAKIPLLGLGTWQAPKGEVGAAVKIALECGYRHIDCAAIYGNEGEVGESLAAAFAGSLRRTDVFVTSKLFNSEHAAVHVRAACVKSLADLQLDSLGKKKSPVLSAHLFFPHTPILSAPPDLVRRPLV